MICVNAKCECCGQEMSGSNIETDGTLTARATCVVCGEVLVAAEVEPRTAAVLAGDDWQLGVPYRDPRE